MKTILILALLVALSLAPPVALTQNAIDGFSSARSADQRRWEEQFRAIPNPKRRANIADPDARAVDHRRGHVATRRVAVESHGLPPGARRSQFG